VTHFANASDDEAEYLGKLCALLPFLLDLHDTVYESLTELDPLFPWATGREDARRDPISAVTPFMNRPCRGKVASAFIFPVLAALRVVVKADSIASNDVTFVYDPYKLLSEQMPEFVQLLKHVLRNQAHGSIGALGREKELWLKAENKVDTKLKIAKELGKLVSEVHLRDLPLKQPLRMNGVTVHRDADDPTYRSPISVTLYGRTVPVQSWKEAYVMLCSILRNGMPDRFDERAEQFRGTTRAYLSKESVNMLRPVRLPGSNLWIETNLSARAIVSNWERLLRLLEVPLSEYRIETRTTA